MNRSGMKRGLAVAAVSALTLAGLSTTAQADTLDDEILAFGGTDAALYSPNDDDGPSHSTKVDGNGNTTVRLLAGVPKTIGGVTVNAVRFQTPANPAWLNQVVPVSAGAALYEWAPPANQGVVTVEVFALGSGGVDLSTAPVQTADVDTDTLNNREATSLDGGLRAELGYFLNPSVGSLIGSVTGKTGRPVVNTDVDVLSPVTGVPLAALNQIEQTSGPDTNGLRGFSALFEVPIGIVIPFLTDNEDDLVVWTTNGHSEEAQVYSAYQQIVQKGTPTLAVEAGSTANVAGDSDGVGGQPANDNFSFYTLNVDDQRANPVGGATVFESDAAGNAVDGNGTFRTPGGGLEDPQTTLTDANGNVRIRLDEGTMGNGLDLDPAANIQATYYVVDANGNGSYTPLSDTIVKVSQTNIAAAAGAITITSDLGPAMDDDENPTITMTVTDASGNPIVGASPVIEVSVNNIDDPSDSFGFTDPGLIIPATGADGKTVVGPIPNGLFNAENDQAEITIRATAAGGVTGVLEIESDTAAVSFDKDSFQAQNGSTVDATGVLELPSGTALPGRLVGLDYYTSVDANGPVTGVTAGNSGFDQTGQPAGTVSGTPTTASATTAANGSFGVRVKDPAVPNGEELNSKILAELVGLSANETNANYGTIDGVNIGVQAAVSDVADVDFLRSLAPATVVIINEDDIAGDDSDGLAAGLFPDGGDEDTLLPGGLGIGSIEARNSDGVLLTDADIDLTIDEGFFVNPADPFEATPAPNTPVDFKSAGKTITVNTGDANGTFLANIERNEGFDDDGLVDDKVRAVAGASNDTHDLTWSTNGVPVNPRATNPLVVELSADQESSVLPKARAGDTKYVGPVTGGVNPDGSGQLVNYDVRAFDQFENPVSQDLDTTDNSPVANFAYPISDDSQFALGQPAIQAYSEGTTNQSLEVELDGARETIYVDNFVTSEFDPTNPAAAIQPELVDIEETTDAINWYELDLNNSEFSLGQAGPNTVPVGTTVTEVFTAVDQESQYIDGLIVDFLRAGPGTEDDDSCAEDALNLCPRTNSNGKAFLDFAGGSEGLATIDVVAYEDDGTRFRQVASDTVRFSGTQVNPPSTKKRINPSIKGKNVRSGNDWVLVRAKAADGAKVKVYKIVGKNRRVLVREGNLNERGVYKTVIKDNNGRRITAYKAVVSNTSDTQRGVTNRRQIRKIN